MAVSIFCSYSHTDEEFRDELKKHLSILQRRGAITGWYDRRIEPAKEWRGQIDSHIRSTQIILLLISPDFLASGYCDDIEMKVALERHAQGKAIVIPVIVRPVDWAATPFAHLAVLPSDGTSVIFWRNDVFGEIAFAISDIVEGFQPATAPPKIEQSRILTPALVQMVTVVQLNRQELREMIVEEIARNPVFEGATEAGGELTPAAVESLSDWEGSAEPNDQAKHDPSEGPRPDGDVSAGGDRARNDGGLGATVSTAEEPSQSEADPFERINFDNYFEKYLDPEFKSKTWEWLASAPDASDSGEGACPVEPDVLISKEGDAYIVTLNENDMPRLRLKAACKRMMDCEQASDERFRNDVQELYASALQLIKHIEQRKQTILRVCRSIVRRQLDFLEHGIDHLKPMMIREISEELAVHPSTVARVVANKCARTPQGVFELRYFFSQAGRLS